MIFYDIIILYFSIIKSGFFVQITAAQPSILTEVTVILDDYEDKSKGQKSAQTGIVLWTPNPQPVIIIWDPDLGIVCHSKMNIYHEKFSSPLKQARGEQHLGRCKW